MAEEAGGGLGDDPGKGLEESRRGGGRRTSPSVQKGLVTFRAGSSHDLIADQRGRGTTRHSELRRKTGPPVKKDVPETESVFLRVRILKFLNLEKEEERDT